MKNFKYCIWLTPYDDNDEWYSYTNGFEPHITIFYYLDKQEAYKKIKLIHDYDINLTITDELIKLSEEGFNSLYYKVSINKDLDWWPENAHISFRYKYDDITEKEIDELKNKIKKKTARFSKIKIKKCDGHFSYW